MIMKGISFWFGLLVGQKGQTMNGFMEKIISRLVEDKNKD